MKTRTGHVTLLCRRANFSAAKATQVANSAQTGARNARKRPIGMAAVPGMSRYPSG